jgi:4-hydroxy-4-methyl-2-oxoglutarate aldolase
MPLHPRIVPGIERAPALAVKTLGALGVATVHEAYNRTGLMFGIRPVSGPAISGPAVTCLNVAGDNLMLHAALDYVQPGDVLVVAVTSPSEHGMFGDLLATSCRARGVAGVIIDAGARDVETLREMGYPVWARHVSASGSIKHSPGWVNIPVTVGASTMDKGGRREMLAPYVEGADAR